MFSSKHYIIKTIAFKDKVGLVMLPFTPQHHYTKYSFFCNSGDINRT